MTEAVAVDPAAELPDLADAHHLRIPAGDAVLGGFAWWQRGPAPAVVLAHGMGQDATYHADRARAFHARGWHAVSVASRGWPGSTGDPDDYGRSAETDLAAVVGTVRDRGCTELWLLGFSAGGLWLARGLPAVTGVSGLVTVNSPMNVRTTYRDTMASRMRRFYDTVLTARQQWDCSPVSVAEQITMPLLSVAGADDGMVPATQAEEICALVPRGTCLQIAGMRHLPTDEQWELILASVQDWMAGVRQQG